VVRERIAEVYGITAEVVPAPVGIDTSGPTEAVPALTDWADGFLLVVSRLLPYRTSTASSRLSGSSTSGWWLSAPVPSGSHCRRCCPGTPGS
jgi:hypothetical protein